MVQIKLSRPAIAVTLLLSSSWLFTACRSSITEDRSRQFEIVNESGKKLVIDWVNPKTGKAQTLKDGFADGQSTLLNSFVNHTFAIHEPSGSCNGQNRQDCTVQYITVNDKQKQVVQIKRGLEIVYRDDHQDAPPQGGDFARECREQAIREMELEGASPTAVMDSLSQCLEGFGADLIKQKTDEISFESRIRLELSSKMENITCADPNKELSEPIEIREWTHDDGAASGRGDDVVTRKVFVMHNRPASQIHVLEDFITKEECDAIALVAKPILHRGTVANGSGGSTLSDSRKAWQAGVRVPWEKEGDDDPIARVARRLYDYTNDAVGYNLTVEGQEDLMSIQYFGKGKNSTEPPDQYRPHCDGDCDGLPHKVGGRVATMVMYCDVPDLGGGTNFQNSNVYVKPKLHSAAFFSYMDPVTHRQETGFTSHSGCPVIEGTKRIAVQWMRIGVDNENPWDSFNTLTIKKSIADEED